MFLLKRALEKQLLEALNYNLKWLGVVANSALEIKVLGDVYLAGGAIVSAIDGKPPKDLDLFFITPDIAASVFAKIREVIKKQLPQVEMTFTIEADTTEPELFRGTTEADLGAINTKLKTLGADYPIKYVSKNAVTFKNGIQFITRFIGEPKKVFTTFDYEHCKVYYKLSAVDSGNLVFEGQSAEAIATRNLLYSGDSRFVCSALYRLSKFVKRGWKVTPQVFLRLLESATKINWTSIESVEEELNGFYALTPADIDYIVKELKQKENFSIKEVTDLVEGL